MKIIFLFIIIGGLHLKCDAQFQVKYNPEEHVFDTVKSIINFRPSYNSLKDTTVKGFAVTERWLTFGGDGTEHAIIAIHQHFVTLYYDEKWQLLYQVDSQKIDRP